MYYTHYINRPLHSFGGRVRIWMNVVPVLLYFILSKKRTLYKEQGGDFWKLLSIAIIISAPLVEYFSTAVDRISLYLSVMQMVLWPRIIIMQSTSFKKALVAVGISLLYFMTLFVWLNFAVHKYAYVPYQNILFLEEKKVCFDYAYGIVSEANERRARCRDTKF